MKKSAGFTLIELVIVIVILGILGAVAAPRFINMQGDAYEANVKALNGSIQSAMTLANTKAILNGYDKTISQKVNSKENFKADDSGDLVFVYGFPAASQDGIIAMLQDSESFSNDENSLYELDNYEEGAAGVKTLAIAPKARNVLPAASGADNKCQVEYTQATNTTPAKVKAFTKGC